MNRQRKNKELFLDFVISQVEGKNQEMLTVFVLSMTKFS